MGFFKGLILNKKQRFEDIVKLIKENEGIKYGKPIIGFLEISIKFFISSIKTPTMALSPHFVIYLLSVLRMMLTAKMIGIILKLVCQRKKIKLEAIC